MRFVVGLLWVFTALATIPAVGFVLISFTRGMSAPQQAATAAVALCMVIIPYVFTRAIEGFSKT